MKQYGLVSLIALAIAATVGLFVPLETALANRGELNVGLAELAELLAPSVVVLTTGLLVLALASAFVIGERALAVLCAFLVCLWAQAALFQWDYGHFDGDAIDWSIHAGKGLIEAAIWAGALIVAAIRPRPIARWAGWIALALIFAQSISLVAALRSGEELAGAGERSAESAAAPDTEDASAFTTYSSERHVIVIVLDTLQSDFFAELLRQPDYAAAMPPGFTYYRNAVAPYPTTRLSLPSMLTSKTPEYDVSAQGKVEQMRRSVPALLARGGWRSAVATISPDLLKCGGKARQRALGIECRSAINLAALLQGMTERAAARIEAIDAARSVYQVSVFRLAPHYAKRWVYDAGEWQIRDPLPDEEPLAEVDVRIGDSSRRDLIILETLAREARPGSPAPTFKFLHFFGIHVPTSIDRACGWNGLERSAAQSVQVRGAAREEDRRRTVAASRCLLGRVFELLRRLDEIGVYDESLVFVVGDHGRQLTPIDPESADPPLPAPPRAEGLESTTPPGLWNSSLGVPLFLVKPVGAKDPLRVSDAPVSLCDMPRSIFASLGVEADFGCESIFEVGDRRGSPRIHYRVNVPGAPIAKRGDRFHEFRVEGHAWRPNSWRNAATATAE
jgi:hypothetical protein